MGGVSEVVPRPHQREAVAALVRSFEHVSRAQVYLPCGTGKTLVGVWTAEALGSAIVAVFVPSIALASQTVAAWQHAGPQRLRTLVVCSDPTSAVHDAEVGIDGVDPFRDRHDGATTDPVQIASFLAGHRAGTLTLAVCTYHSAAALAQAADLADVEFDLAVADEAHHLAGRSTDQFAMMLDHRRFPTIRRIMLQTATPRIAGGQGVAVDVDTLVQSTAESGQWLSMDDEAVFGPVAYRMSTRAAIDAGLLAPYRVVVSRAGATSVAAHADTLSAGQILEALASAVETFGCRRILTFHNRVADARTFAGMVSERGWIGKTRIRGFAVDGRMTAMERHQILGELDDDSAITVVASARCLNEGVDLPAVDAVVFAAPRTSTTAIVQMVGRVLRTAQGKTVGTVIIPVLVPDESDDQEAVAETAYANVWRVLRAMQAHDEQIVADLNTARAKYVADRRPRRVLPHWLHVTGEEVRDQLAARLLRPASPIWERSYQLFVRAADECGGASAITTTMVVDGVNVGLWALKQRFLYSSGDLDPTRAGRLEQIDGWCWSGATAADLRSVRIVEDLAAEHRTIFGDLPKPLSEYRDGLNRPLSFWIASVIRRHSDLDLDIQIYERLDAVEEWTWQPYTDVDALMLKAFRGYVEWEGHADVPAAHVTEEHQLRLGAWLTYQRRLKVVGMINPAVAAAIEEASPVDAKGARTFAWRHNDTLWELSYLLCCKAIQTLGSVSGMKAEHREEFAGAQINVHAWIRRQRFLYRRGELGEDLTTRLRALPGFIPAADSGERVQDSSIMHGTEQGARRGCHCQDCLHAIRRFHRQYKSNSVEVARTAVGWTSCIDAATHLQQIKADAGQARRHLVTAGAISCATAVPRSVVAMVLSGKANRCHPAYRQKLTEVKLTEVLASWAEPGTRGRRTLPDVIDGDGEHIASMLDQLKQCGWSEALISAAMGFYRSSVDKRCVSVLHERALTRVLEEYGPTLTPPALPLGSPASADTRRRRIAVPKTEALQFAAELLAQGYHPRQAARLAGVDEDEVRGLPAA